MWNKSRNQLFGVKWNVGFIWFAQFLIIYIKSRPSQQWNLAPTLAEICRESKDPNYRMSRTAIYLISASVKQSCWELLCNSINDSWRPSHTYTVIKIYQKDFFSIFLQAPMCISCIHLKNIYFINIINIIKYLININNPIQAHHCLKCYKSRYQEWDSNNLQDFFFQIGAHYPKLVSAFKGYYLASWNGNGILDVSL